MALPTSLQLQIVSADRSLLNETVDEVVIPGFDGYFGVLPHLVDGPLHVERLLGDVVVLALDDLLEAAHRVLARHEHTGRSGELLGDEERLREEALDAARATL